MRGLNNSFGCRSGESSHDKSDAAQQAATARPTRVSTFLGVMKTLSPAQRLIVAGELADAHHDFAAAMERPSREQRTRDIHTFISRYSKCASCGHFAPCRRSRADPSSPQITHNIAVAAALQSTD